MTRPALSIVGDMLLGVSIAGLALAVLVPVLIKTGIVSIGDWAGALVILIVLCTGAAATVLRPGGALRRRSK